MELDQLSRALEVFGPSGVVLSTEQKASLQVSLVILKSSENFHSVVFWGKVQGNRRDYFIAQAFADRDPSKKKSFYSTDCLTWAQLPQLHPVIVASALKITSQFTGNLSNEYIVRERGPAPHEEAPVLPSDAAALRKEEAKEDGSKIIVTTITEDKRLAAVIAGIDHDVGIVPRGAFRKPITGPIERCKTFEGLSTAEAGKLSAYLHFHPSKHVQPKSYAEESQQDRTIDFLDPISDDTPKQSWSLQYQNGSEIVVIRSLVWLGSQFFHTAGKNEFAQVYFGNGVKNTDLPFML